MLKSRPTFHGEGVCVPGKNNVTFVPYPKPMPCVVIFVHGVNSEGEWYWDAENGVVAGLNERLGRRDIKPNQYSEDGRTLKKSANSPVIRFYWGYCAPVEETDDHTFEYKIPLKTRVKFDDASDPNSSVAYSYHPYSHHYPEGKPDEPVPIEPNIKGATYYWGGGPFQNGTTSLNMSWYEGFDPQGVIDEGSRFFNPEVDRPLYKSPPRTYYAHASKRLADLIDSIYEKYPNDTVAVVSHSQGTMIALLAMLYVKRVPDTLFVCNSPYQMEDIMLDDIAMGGQAPTSRSHVKTFFNVLDRFQKVKRTPSEEELDGVGGLVDPAPPATEGTRAVDGKGEKQDGPLEDRPMLADVPEPVCQIPWSPSLPTEEPVPGSEDHHNHGRLFVYCSPHDRVMGAAPLDSIGWKGIAATGRGALGDPDQPDQKVNPFEKYDGVLFQRQFVRAHSVGGVPDPENDPETPRYPQDGRPLWIPESPRAMHLFKEHLSIGKHEKIYVNGPRVPNPMPSGNDLAHRDANQSPDPSKNEAGSMSMWDFNETIDPGKKITGDSDFVYYQELIYDRRRDTIADRSDPYRNAPASREQTDEEVYQDLSQIPETPTNHSTILMYRNGELVKRVMAYDLPVGRADSFQDKEFWDELRRKADWLESDPYYLNAASLSSHACTAADDVPEPPAGIDPETRAMAAASKAKLRRNQIKDFDRVE
jgi:pimeloyl-ACP methyl ester carboxylesterase